MIQRRLAELSSEARLALYRTAILRATEDVENAFVRAFMAHHQGMSLLALDNGHTRTVVKRGKLGCATLDAGQVIDVPAFAIESNDSTGAGDSFDAGFLHAWLARSSLTECMRWGNACGSLSTRGIGGTTGQGSLDEVHALLGENA